MPWPGQTNQIESVKLLRFTRILLRSSRNQGSKDRIQLHVIFKILLARLINFGIFFSGIAFWQLCKVESIGIVSKESS